MTSISPVELFPHDYQDAIDRFDTAVRQLGWQCEQLPVDPSHGAGESFHAQIALSPGIQSDGSQLHPNKSSIKALVLSSGLHGIEGFLGSAIQLQFLQQIRRRQTERSGSIDHLPVIILHALNPYGYAELRRTDRDNRDLNRNFLPSSDDFGGCTPLYRRLDPWLNPRRAASGGSLFAWQALWHTVHFGRRPLQAAIAGGQYEFPEGLFFGGHSPAPLADLLRARMPQWLNGAQQVVHLDFHSGLGRWGRVQLLIENSLSDDQRSTISRWCSHREVVEVDQIPAQYQANGSWGRWCSRMFSNIDYLFAVAEFGTYDPLRVLRALRDENLAHHWPDQVADPLAAKLRLKEVFCPRSMPWRNMVLRRADRILQQILNDW